MSKGTSGKGRPTDSPRAHGRTGAPAHDPQGLPPAASWLPLAHLRPWGANPRRNADAVLPVARSMLAFGFGAPLVARTDGTLVAGHTRRMAAAVVALCIGELERALAAVFGDAVQVVTTPASVLVPVRVGDWDEAAAAALAVADNRLGELATWDDAGLAEVLASLNASDPALLLATGFTEADLIRLVAQPGDAGGSTPGALAARFLVPPFTVLDARQGYWLARKRQWMGLGLRSWEGRGQRLLAGGTSGGAYGASSKRVAADGSLEYANDSESFAGTSVFDPVLAELAYRWFCPSGGMVVDPFAGGSVRGVVAARLGLAYCGVDLSAAQVQANEEQAASIAARAAAPQATGDGELAMPPAWAPPRWVVGDSAEAATWAGVPDADLVFSCPPYFDLEVYSEHAADISGMSTAAFVGGVHPRHRQRLRPPARQPLRRVRGGQRAQRARRAARPGGRHRARVRGGRPALLERRRAGHRRWLPAPPRRPGLRQGAQDGPHAPGRARLLEGRPGHRAHRRRARRRGGARRGHGRAGRGRHVTLALPLPVVEQHGRFAVVRDDLIHGGSKTRFLPALIGDAREVVYGGPYCGGAHVALAVVCRAMGRRATLFYAARKTLHWKQTAARDAGADLRFVPAGYLSNVQAKARRYAADAGALFLPLGFDVPAAVEALQAVARGVRSRLKHEPDEVWCATGSGMLARCLAAAFTGSTVHAVAVGLRSHWARQDMPGNVRLHDAGCRFEEEARAPAPFPSCPNYDRKAWHAAAVLSRAARPLFWNVMGDAVPGTPAP